MGNESSGNHSEISSYVYMCIKKLFQKLLFFSNQKNTSKLAKLHMKYLIMKFMMQKRMPENFCLDDLIINFMIFSEPEAQSHKNSRILEMSKNFQFF